MNKFDKDFNEFQEMHGNFMKKAGCAFGGAFFLSALSGLLVIGLLGTLLFFMLRHLGAV